MWRLWLLQRRALNYSVWQCQTRASMQHAYATAIIMYHVSAAHTCAPSHACWFARRLVTLVALLASTLWHWSAVRGSVLVWTWMSRYEALGWYVRGMCVSVSCRRPITAVVWLLPLSWPSLLPLPALLELPSSPRRMHPAQHLQISTWHDMAHMHP